MGVNLINLFHQEAPLAIYSTAVATPVAVPSSQFFSGTEGIAGLISGGALNPLFRQPVAIQDARGIRLDSRVLF